MHIWEKTELFIPQWLTKNIFILYWSEKGCKNVTYLKSSIESEKAVTICLIFLVSLLDSLKLFVFSC